jgi:peptidoglycan/xylan/chitin deacetylase (PgdA/CDA1 family)
MLTYGIDGWIRINQLGYLPKAQKKAILISESPQDIKNFSIFDALTNEELGTFSTVTSKGEFESFQSTYILDFSSFQLQGAFYIKAGLIYSPTIYINKNVYLGTADFLVKFIRQQRWGFNPLLNDLSNQNYDFETTGDETIQNDNNEGSSNQTRSGNKRTKKTEPQKTTQELKLVDVKGGWHNISDFAQYVSTSANTVYQLLFAFKQNPNSFGDDFDANGQAGSNGIPDILDEAKWGLDWLLKMNPAPNVMYHQIGDKQNSGTAQLLNTDENMTDLSWTPGRPVYLSTGKPQGTSTTKNRTTGIASIAGKFTSAYALGSELLSAYYPAFADTLEVKAAESYNLGKEYPGVCQTIPGNSTSVYEEENWSDDMELAAAQLYRLTYDGNYLKEAAGYGHMEPITPWMCSDTAKYYQWYPFINLGHYMMSDVENPRYKKEFFQNIVNGIQRASLSAKENPFNVGVPMIRASNNLVVALATQCRLYRNMTNDSTYIEMETALIDWLFGRNPWGTSMIVNLPKTGDTPTNPGSILWSNNRNALSGGLVSGPVSLSVFKNTPDDHLTKTDPYDRLQSDWAVYHDDYADYATNEPTLDGTASLTYLLANKQLEGVPEKNADKNQYQNGGIVRTDTNKKQISLVFCGNEFADGYKTIRQTLKKLNIKASFFFTGDFYRNSKFTNVIKGLQEDGHYLGANSDKHLLYCSFRNRDSLLVYKSEFINDIKDNYAEMAKFGIKKNQAPFFFPPYEQHNDSISQWCREIGINLINMTPGSLSNNDNSTPEMRDKYYSSNEIFNRILQLSNKQGLNGYILMFHMGCDKHRQDKFYLRLYSLLVELSKAGYDFADLYQATDIVDKNILITNDQKDKKQKRKN